MRPVLYIYVEPALASSGIVDLPLFVKSSGAMYLV